MDDGKGTAFEQINVPVSQDQPKKRRSKKRKILVILVYAFWGGLELIMHSKYALSLSFWVRGWLTEKMLEFGGRDGLTKRRWIMEDIGAGRECEGEKNEGKVNLPDVS